MTNEMRGARWRGAFMQGVAVLLGILIAFAIDAWWEEQGDRDREEALLVALGEELEANRAFFEDDLDRVRREHVETAEYIRDVALGSGTPPSRDSVLAMLWTVSPSTVRDPQRAALDDLLSSGAFQLIRSDSIRRAIARYEQRLRHDLDSQRRANDFWEQDLRPHQDEHGSLVDMLPAGQDHLAGVEVAPPGFEIDVGRFFGNREFANLLAQRAIRFNVIDTSHGRVLETISELRGLIGRELGHTLVGPEGS